MAQLTEETRALVLEILRDLAENRAMLYAEHCHGGSPSRSDRWPDPADLVEDPTLAEVERLIAPHSIEGETPRDTAKMMIGMAAEALLYERTPNTGRDEFRLPDEDAIRAAGITADEVIPESAIDDLAVSVVYWNPDDGYWNADDDR